MTDLIQATSWLHEQPTAERARALGAVNYLLKPINESQLLAAIRKVVKAPQ